MSNISKRRREGTKTKIKTLGDHREFLKRITKSLYYGELPLLPCLSLPVTEISADLFSEAQRGRSLKRLHMDDASEITRNACVSPCSLVLAILYLERLRSCNPDYLAKMPPSELFLVSLMVSNKFLQDDGEEEEVFCDEWATSGGLDLGDLKHLELSFLDAIDWKVFVSEKSFEAGLSWLEKQVAMKQAHLRGFFTYADLAATSDNIHLCELVKSFSSACLAMTLGYVSSLMTLVTSTLLISQACLPYLQHGIATSQSNVPATVEMNANIITSNSGPDIIAPELGRSFSNITLDDLSTINILLELQHSFTTGEDRVSCCKRWSRFNEPAPCPERQHSWYDSIVTGTFEASYEAWWSKTSVMAWLYQSSLITPVQKWLQKADTFSNFIKEGVINYTGGLEKSKQCNNSVKSHIGASKKCENQWPNLCKVSALVVSVSDR